MDDCYSVCMEGARICIPFTVQYVCVCVSENYKDMGGAVWLRSAWW